MHFGCTNNIFIDLTDIDMDQHNDDDHDDDEHNSFNNSDMVHIKGAYWISFNFAIAILNFSLLLRIKFSLFQLCDSDMCTFTLRYPL